MGPATTREIRGSFLQSCCELHLTPRRFTHLDLLLHSCFLGPLSTLHSPHLFLGLPLPSIATGFQNPQLCPHHWTSTRRATPDLPLRSLVELEAMPLLGAAHDGETPRFSQHASARSTLPHPSVVFHHSAAAHVCNNDLGYHFACGTITSIAALLYVIARDVAVTTPM